MQDGDWRLIHVYGQYRILHCCYEAAYSWKHKYGKKAWAAVDEQHGICTACDAVPPDAMVGMVSLLEWER